MPLSSSDDAEAHAPSLSAAGGRGGRLGLRLAIHRVGASGQITRFFQRGNVAAFAGYRSQGGGCDGYAGHAWGCPC